jgi:carbon storage regulator
MLVLTRKLGERIVIDDQIVITVVELRRGRVRLGIEAPAQVNVVRKELQGRPHVRTPAQPAVATGS